MRVVSPDGAWVFEDGLLRSAEVELPVFTIDWFERWTFARFLPGGELALAFESGQPFDWEFGSYGDRRWGVQVLALRSSSRWELVAIEHDCRDHDQRFEPDDVAWSSRGVLAWLDSGALNAVVLDQPRGEIVPDLLPEADSASEQVAFEIELYGSWRSLAFAEGLLIASDEQGVDEIDLDRQLRRRDGGEWQPLEVWSRRR